jgi:antitoxin ParD1/3/4
MTFLAILSTFEFKEARVQTMNISLPETLKDFVDQQIAAGRYSTASEYVRELIRNDEKQKAEEQLSRLLREGLQSKETELTRDDWKAIRAEAVARVKQTAKHKR